MKRRFAGPLIALGLVACSDGTGVAVGEIDIVVTTEGLQLTSYSDRDLFYQAVDADALVLWAGPEAVTMCQDPDCPHLPAHQTVTVAWPDVLAWSESTARVTVYWWQVVPEGDGSWRMSGGSIRSREVTRP